MAWKKDGEATGLQTKSLNWPDWSQSVISYFSDLMCSCTTFGYIHTFYLSFKKKQKKEKKRKGLGQMIFTVFITREFTLYRA